MLYQAAIKAFSELLDESDLSMKSWEKSEYIRGGVELLCDLFGFSMDERDRVMNDIIKYKENN